MNPDGAWFTEVVRRFVASVPNEMAKPGLLLRDRDDKFRVGDGAFDTALGTAGVKSMRLPHRSPNLNAYVERLIQSIEVECLDHFIVLGTRDLDHLLAEYIEYHNGSGRTYPWTSPRRHNGALPLAPDRLRRTTSAAAIDSAA